MNAIEISKTISEPLMIVVPSKELSSDDFGRLYSAIQSLLDKVSSKIQIDFKILIESAVYFDGYECMREIADEQNDRVPF